jgi:RNA polymerase sigma-70 factor (ECF subfamily)
MTLERLSPLERAAFLLHDVFDMGFAEVAETLERGEAACRQLAARARDHVRASRPRFAPSKAEMSRLADSFHEAVLTGDVGRLAHLLAEDAILYADGGGKKAAVLNPIRGRDKIMRFFAGIAQKQWLTQPAFIHRMPINRAPGFVIVDAGGAVETLALDISGGRIAAIYSIRNPDKLTHISLA